MLNQLRSWAGAPSAVLSWGDLKRVAQRCRWLLFLLTAMAVLRPRRGRAAPEELGGEGVLWSIMEAPAQLSGDMGTHLPGPVAHSVHWRSRSCPEVGLRIRP